MVRPIAIRDREYVRRPLNVLLGSPSHIAILRALNTSSAGLTGRQIARLAEVAVQATHDALSRLEAAGLVRWRPAGSAHVYELNRDHFLFRNGILPLLEAEAEFRSRIRAVLRQALTGHVVSAAIFGSTARFEDRPDSDLDLLLVFKNQKAKEKGIPNLDQVSERLRREFGVRLSSLAQTHGEFMQGYRRGGSFHRQVAGEGETIAGQELSELVRG